MKQVWILVVCAFVFGESASESQTTCEYDHDSRGYFCKGVRDVFPNDYYGNYHLQCSNCHIKYFTNKTFPFTNSLLSFNVSNSRIKYVTRRSFSGLTNAQYIYLQNNEILDVAPEAFAGLRQVYELHLENNQLTELVPGFLADLEANTVDLNNNKIKLLSNNVFGNSLGILILDLSRNQIKSIEADAFESLENLEILNLEHNQFCHLKLGTFKHLPNLKHLNLADNKLAKLPLGTFSGLRGLQHLNLANNSLSAFDGNSLIPFMQLSRLDLSGNGIFYFDAHTLYMNVPSLRSLRLDDNLFSCSHLIGVIQYLRKATVEVINSVGRYEVQNVNGIACTTELILNHSVDFEPFLKVVMEETKKSSGHC